MKFTKLRLLGFKSFVEPGEFVIERGLTGVVGPNGCGKSNLVEALRWVMGENSYKNMRASGMDDVIFSGSGQRPARNTAEVGLYLDNPTAPRRRLQRRRRDPGHPPHRARGRFGLPHQRQGSARQGCATALRRRLDRRPLALDGRTGPHRRTDPGQTPGAPRSCWKRPPAFPACIAPPRGGIAHARRRNQSRTAGRHVPRSSKARSTA
jgi:hypothetical protein